MTWDHKEENPVKVFMKSKSYFLERIAWMIKQGQKGLQQNQMYLSQISVILWIKFILEAWTASRTWMMRRVKKENSKLTVSFQMVEKSDLMRTSTTSKQGRKEKLADRRPLVKIHYFLWNKQMNREPCGTWKARWRKVAQIPILRTMVTALTLRICCQGRKTCHAFFFVKSLFNSENQGCCKVKAILNLKVPFVWLSNYWTFTGEVKNLKGLIQ